MKTHLIDQRSTQNGASLFRRSINQMLGMPQRLLYSKGSEGFSILEVMMALGIISFCLITLLALLPIGIAANQCSLSQTEATSIASAIVADLKSPIDSNRESPRFKFKVPAIDDSPTPKSSPISLYFLGGGVPSGRIGDGAVGLTKYRANVWFLPPGAQQRAAIQVRILITWPGKADPTPGSMPSRFSGSLDMVTAIYGTE